MAPINRREHRQQRVRGAGPSSVQTSFGFNFGTLGVESIKQSSLPPHKSSRRTPVRSTSRGASGSAKRYRSTSVQRSIATQYHLTPKYLAVTPQLGKRKRGVHDVRSKSNEDSEDELSPDRDDEVRSIEKSRRVVGAVFPIHEELDDGPDELSMLDDSSSVMRKSYLDNSAVVNGTPVSTTAKSAESSEGQRQKTSIANRVGTMPATSRHSVSRRSKSVTSDTAVSRASLNSRPKSAASHFGPAFNTPGAALAIDDSEDELSPQLNLAGTIPRAAPKAMSSLSKQVNNDSDSDELSSPMQSTLSQPKLAFHGESSLKLSKSDKQAKMPSTAPGKSTENIVTVPKRAKDQQEVTGKKAIEGQATPPGTKFNRKPRKRPLVEDEEDLDMDESSPGTRKLEQPRIKPNPKQQAAEVSNVEDPNDNEEFVAEDRQTSENGLVRKQQPTKNPQHQKDTILKPQRKRHKLSGVRQAITVMRMKGLTVRGITLADTTRQILEETINHRLKRMVEKIQITSDSTERKRLRSEVNLALSFKESLDEKLLDLQDANDVLTSNSQKMKLFKRDNVELRKVILTLQNSRQEVALEHDEVYAGYQKEKTKVDSRNQLSTDLFDIESAVQRGRERARKEGREDEGPEMSLSMLIDMVGRDVGSSGGGLLSNVKAFNGLLENAAVWLEGRA